MSDLFLKAPTEAAMMAALDAAGLVSDDKWQQVTVTAGGVTDVHVIGVMYGAGGAALPGYHANVRTTDPKVALALQTLSGSVKTPSFVFA